MEEPIDTGSINIPKSDGIPKERNGMLKSTASKPCMMRPARCSTSRTKCLERQRPCTLQPASSIRAMSLSYCKPLLPSTMFANAILTAFSIDCRCNSWLDMPGCCVEQPSCIFWPDARFVGGGKPPRSFFGGGKPPSLAPSCQRQSSGNDSLNANCWSFRIMGANGTFVMQFYQR